MNYIVALRFTWKIFLLRFLKKCSIKMRPSRTKFLYENLYPSPTLSYAITKKSKRFFCDTKVIKGPKPPEGSNDRVLFRTLRDGVLFRILSPF